MRAVILAGHGSLRRDSGAAMIRLAARAREAGVAPLVAAGFLNYSRPTLAEALARCMARGATEAVLVPYLLVPGHFARVALPRALTALRDAFPALSLTLADCLGEHPVLAELVIKRAEEAQGVRRQASGESSEGIDQHLPTLEEAQGVRRQASGESSEGIDQHLPTLEEAQGVRRQASGESSEGIDQHLPTLDEMPPSHASGLTPHALLLMAHGSPDESANAPIARVAERVRASGRFAAVRVAFLDLNAPAISVALDELATSSERIIALPYFLQLGGHVAEDLPALIAQARLRHPAVAIDLAPHLGYDPLLAQVVADRAQEAVQHRDAEAHRGQ